MQVVIKLLQNFAHDTTTMLSYHVQYFGVVWLWEMDLYWNLFAMEL